ncbi:MAG: hypothetical protein JXB88_25120 [Spirochaetales bacterium]|nr:hypothetical protein [Spirochaetales bacterium]
MKKNSKIKKRIRIFMIIAFTFIFTIVSCKPWPDIIKGAGIWGKSKYGKAEFGEERKRNIKEEWNLWK